MHLGLNYTYTACVSGTKLLVFVKEIEELVKMEIPGLASHAAGSLRLLELRSLHVCKALVTLLETQPGLHFGA